VATILMISPKWWRNVIIRWWNVSFRWWNARHRWRNAVPAEFNHCFYAVLTDLHYIKSSLVSRLWHAVMLLRAAIILRRFLVNV